MTLTRTSIRDNVRMIMIMRISSVLLPHRLAQGSMRNRNKPTNATVDVRSALPTLTVKPASKALPLKTANAIHVTTHAHLAVLLLHLSANPASPTIDSQTRDTVKNVLKTANHVLQTVFVQPALTVTSWNQMYA